MDKWFFIEVQTYKSVNNMGKELAQYVYDKYDQVVVHENCISSINADIIEKMEALEAKYPKCKAFAHECRKYSDKYGQEIFDISAKPSNVYNDNYVFILRTTYIRKMNLETTLSL
ncbi:hypothetical protein L6475_01875 [Prevotella sp. E9-3]|uniref:hypothetical protein n=1 Tax=Prevotella sp. E9-3 TaxID=2913621 RepID=UPI001EDA0465|nr:hypothetical protein [Prevotella sp. E9-3]UKK48742.1 hypothetical protein L6475_01875 [Prevotella sp. E9-3]